MGDNDLKERTKSFAIAVVRVVSSLLRSVVADVMGKQLLRCATSVGANYRAASRAQSRSDFAAKLAIVIEECDEVQYWLDLLYSQGIIDERHFGTLHMEAGELTAIFVASRKTSMANRARKH